MEIEKRDVHRLWSALIGKGWRHDFEDDTWSDGHGLLRVSLVDAMGPRSGEVCIRISVQAVGEAHEGSHGYHG
jgi:hypothetical protein